MPPVGCPGENHFALGIFIRMSPNIVEKKSIKRNGEMMTGFASKLCMIPLFIRCSKCSKILEIDTYSHPYINVQVEHKCKPKKESRS